MSGRTVLDDAATGLFGREAELEAVATLLGDAAARPAALVITGEPGLGKTALAAAAVAQARAAGVPTLIARPDRFERDLAFAGLGDLLEPALDAVRGELPEPQRMALDVALLRSSAPGARVDQRAVSVAVLSALRALATGRTLVVIDDLQWLDVPSARSLEFALRRLATEPVRVFATLRDGEAQELGLVVERALGDECTRPVALRPLTVASLDSMLQSRLGAALPAPTLAELGRVSAGNPFYALELATAFLQRQEPLAADEPFPVPGSLRGLLSARVAGQPSQARDVLLVAASLAQPSREALVGALGENIVREGLRQALAAGMLEGGDERLRFAHPLLASTVYLETPQDERRALHRRLADVVGEIGERARHLALGTSVPDRDVAAALDDAARSAALRGAPSVAATFAERAHALTPPEDAGQSARRLVDAAEHHLLAGDAGRARRLLDQALETASGPVRARARHRLAVVAYWAEGVQAALAHLEAAGPEAVGDAALLAAIERDLAVALMQGPSVRLARPHAERAVEQGEASGDRTLVADALNVGAMTELLSGGGLRRDWLERAETLLGSAAREPSSRPGVLDCRICHPIALKWADEFAGARKRFEALLRIAQERHEEALLAPILFQLGEMECWAGNLHAADRHAQEGMRAARQAGQGALMALSLNTAGLVAALRGDTAAASAAARRAHGLCERNGDSRHMMRAIRTLGLVELVAGEFAAACRWFGQIAELAEAAGYGDPGVLRYEADEIEALIGMRDHARAHARLDELEARARRVQRVSALATAERSRGLLLAARGDVTEARSALLAALEHHDRSPEPLQRARTQLALGRIERRRRQKRSAREALESAHRTFEQLGAHAWSAQAVDELSRIGGRPLSTRELTQTESRIAALATAGATNREIAAVLYLSPKTVEAHVSRIYRKLGVNSRRELRHRLRDGRGAIAATDGPSSAAAA